MAGTDEQFELIVAKLQLNIKNYDDKKIKYIQYLDTIDAVFNSGSWNKKEFYEELNKRLGIETNDSRRADKEKRQAAQHKTKAKTSRSKKRAV